MESGTEPTMKAITEPAMEAVMKPPETIWKSIRDRDQLHKRFKHDPSLLAAMESGTEPVTEPAMKAITEPVTKPALGAVTESAMEVVMKPHLEVHVKIANP
ncbi:hypothetical protein CFP56_023147 [Quercus suber]|uniref:Uncharacterized protein n=1 Tax=Quercus suber TaxID=58331 RepID=A0AAW0M0W5_QUESU